MQLPRVRASVSLLSVLLVAVSSAAVPAIGTGNAARPAALDGLPLAFEPNRGQVDAPVQFVAHGPGYRVFLAASEAVLALAPSPAGEQVVRVVLAGGSVAPVAEPIDPLPGTVNYYFGTNPEAWHVGVPTFARVRYRDVYPGIDLEYYGTRQELEYDFRVAPGADPAAILLSFDGAGPLALDAEGNLAICLGDGALVHRAPSLYQEAGGVRRPIAGRFALRGGSMVGFEVGDYDASAALIIDPVVLSYSTYLGGSAGDGARDVAVDGAGNVYVTGWAWSRDFPTLNALQPAKPDPENVYCGVVPYPPPHCYSNCPFDPCQDSFVTKLAADGASLLYSTYLGGTSDDRAMALAVDGAGNAYVTGRSYSDDFPTLNPFPDLSGGDVFVTKLDPAGALAFSTHWGTGSYSVGEDIVVDADGKVFIAGTTSAWGLPAAPSGFWRSRSTWTGGMCEVGGPWVHECTVGFVAKLDLTGPTTEYATFVGRAGMDDRATALAVDPAGNAYVGNLPPACSPRSARTGRCWSINSRFAPTRSLSTRPATPTSPGQRAPASSPRTGRSIVSAAATARAPTPSSPGSRRTGRPTSTRPTSAARAGTMHRTSRSTATGTLSSSAPRRRRTSHNTGRHRCIVRQRRPLQRRRRDVVPGCVRRTKLGAAGQSLVFSTYLGGAAEELAGGVALAPSGDIWVAGATKSADFPTATPIQAARLGAEDAFAARITETGCRFEYSTAVPESARVGAALAFDATLVATGCGGAATYEWDFGDGSPHALQEDASHAYGANGTYLWSLTVTFQGQSRSVGGSIRIGCLLSCSASVPAAAQAGASLPFAAAAVLSDCYDAPSFTWEFGDGSPATSEQNPTHAYPQAGAFPWTVTVTADDATCGREGTVRVFAPPTIFTDGFETDLAAWSVTSTGAKAWGQLHPPRLRRDRQRVVRRRRHLSRSARRDLQRQYSHDHDVRPVLAGRDEPRPRRLRLLDRQPRLGLPGLGRLARRADVYVDGRRAKHVRRPGWSSR